MSAPHPTSLFHRPFPALVRRARLLAMPACFTLALASPSCAIAAKAPRNTLWRLVHTQCLPAARHGAYPPAPCVEVTRTPDERRGYAVLKDRTGRYQYLTIPLARVSGIESPALLAPDAPNYFASAWAARLYVDAALHRRMPRDALILMVNSSHGRSQDQLHIHVECIRPDVRDALARAMPALSTQWRSLPQPLPPHGHAYQARWVAGDELPVNPFQVLARALPAGDRMALHSLAVVGTRGAGGEPGFILLSGHVDAASGDRGSGDELLDHACSIADLSAPSHPGAVPQ